MKTPYLKLEIYSTLNEAAVNQDKSTQRRQRMSDKATIPVVKTVVALKEIEKKVKRDVSNQTWNNIRAVSFVSHQSDTVQNKLFTGAQIKNTTGVCDSLESSYKSYAKSSSTVDQLFDEPTVKKMRQNLKHSSERKSSLSISSSKLAQPKLAEPKQILQGPTILQKQTRTRPTVSISTILQKKQSGKQQKKGK